jgi:hypothetical protein
VAENELLEYENEDNFNDVEVEDNKDSEESEQSEL